MTNFKKTFIILTIFMTFCISIVSYAYIDNFTYIIPKISDTFKKKPKPNDEIHISFSNKSDDDFTISYGIYEPLDKNGDIYKKISTDFDLPSRRSIGFTTKYDFENYHDYYIKYHFENEKEPDYFIFNPGEINKYDKNSFEFSIDENKKFYFGIKTICKNPDCFPVIIEEIE